MGLYWLGNLATILPMFSLLVMLPQISQEFNLTSFEMGLLSSIAWLSMSAFALPFGAWLSMYRPKPLVTATLFLGALAGLAQAWAPSYALLFLSRLVFVVSGVARFTAAPLIIQQWFVPREVARVNGVTAGIANVGQMLALAATPLLILLVGGWRNVFSTYGILMGLVAFVWWAFAREGEALERPRRGFFQSWAPLAVFRRHPSLWVVAACQIGSALAFAAFLTFWPVFATQVRGIPLTTTGALLSLWPIGSVIGAFSAEFLARLLGRAKPIIWFSGFGLVVSYLLLISVDYLPVTALLLFAIGFFCLVVPPLIQSIPYAYPDIDYREVTVALGLIQTLTAGGAGLGPLVAGGLTQVSGSLTFALAVCGLCASTLATLGFFVPETFAQHRAGRVS